MGSIPGRHATRQFFGGFLVPRKSGFSVGEARRLFSRKSENGSNVTNYDASNFSAPAYFKKRSLAKLYALKISASLLEQGFFGFIFLGPRKSGGVVEILE
jgi:hypothetical protein